MSAISAAKLSTSKPTISLTQTSGSVHMNCMVCGRCEKLLRCSRCKTAVYCSKEHQKLDWKQHKSICSTHSSSSAASSMHYAISSQVPDSKKKSKFIDRQATTLTNNSNHNEIICEEPLAGSSVPEFHEFKKSAYAWASQSLNSTLKGQNGANMPTHEFNGVKDFPQLDISHNKSGKTAYEKIQSGMIVKVCKDLINDMDQYGIHVIERFMGEELGESVLKEVMDIYSAGLFKDGKLVSNRAGANDSRNIRSDQIAWLDGKEEKYPIINLLISQVDKIVMGANKMHANGKLGEYTINERTGIMVACYPGNGAHYVKHVDNPHGDGRRITAIYYLNKNWDVKEHGGLLRIFPKSHKETVADIKPDFDKIVFFWSDNRNPHEVLPAKQTRYAITVWYYDAEERNKARKTFQNEPEGFTLRPKIRETCDKEH